MAGQRRRPNWTHRLRERPRWANLSRLAAADLPRAENTSAGNRLLGQCLRDCPLWSTSLVAGAFLKAVSALLLPAALASGIDAAASGSPLHHILLGVGGILALATLSDALVELANAYYLANVTARVRTRLFRHIVDLGVAGRNRFASGDLLSRLTVDTARPASFLPVLLTAAVSVFTLLGCVVALAWTDWTLALAFLLGVPLALLVVRLFIARAGGSFLRYQQLQADVVTLLLDALRGSRTIRASGTGEREIGRILRPLPELSETGRRVWNAQRQVSWQLLLLMPVLQVTVLSVGGFELAAGRISAGALVGASGYVMVAVNSFEAVDAVVRLLSAKVGATRAGTVLATPAPQRQATTASPDCPGGIELRAATVRAEDRVVLDHLDLTVASGTSVAVVGRSGAGKSTLTQLVGGLVVPDSGTVTVDGAPPSTAVVSYAFEQPYLLGATLHDMIAYARPGASREQVHAAARTAQADDFITRLPDGYDTAVDDVALSGGEVQRLGLARAILADARVLVLDDATSSLDTATEVRVTHALAEVLTGRTSLVVAHRATTAARADLVAWLDAGRIRALASHSALWSSEPDYRAVLSTDLSTLDGAVG